MTTRPRLAPPLEHNGRVMEETPHGSFSPWEAHTDGLLASLKQEQELQGSTLNMIAGWATRTAPATDSIPELQARIAGMEAMMLQLQAALISRLLQGQEPQRPLLAPGSSLLVGTGDGNGKARSRRCRSQEPRAKSQEPERSDHA